MHRICTALQMSKLSLKKKEDRVRNKNKSERGDDDVKLCTSIQSSSKTISSLFASSSDCLTNVKNQFTHKYENIDDLTSKHFKSTKVLVSVDVLKDSSDFQPEKQSKVVAPQLKCDKKIAERPKRAPKKARRSKDQHDIRKILEKKHNLIEYSKQFEKVCSSEGIDVNPEHLQLAIALSRSVTEVHGPCEDSQDISDSHEFAIKENRIRNIRKTLDEFGFKVRTKCLPVQDPKRKGKRKEKFNYLLVTSSVEEKRQKVNEEVSNILLEVIESSHESQHPTLTCLSSSFLEQNWSRDCSIFFKSSLPYTKIIEEDFYITELISPSSSKVGCLLKDWGSIPGREKSPERVVESPNFKNYNLNPEQFNALLSSKMSDLYLIGELNLQHSDGPSPKQNVRTAGENVPFLNIDSHKVFNNSRCESPDIFEDDSYADQEQVSPVSLKDVEGNPEETLEIINSSDDELPAVCINRAISIAVSAGSHKASTSADALCPDLKRLSDDNIADQSATKHGSFNLYNEKIEEKGSASQKDTSLEKSIDLTQEDIKQIPKESATRQVDISQTDFNKSKSKSFENSIHITQCHKEADKITNNPSPLYENIDTHNSTSSNYNSVLNSSIDLTPCDIKAERLNVSEIQNSSSRQDRTSPVSDDNSENLIDLTQNYDKIITHTNKNSFCDSGSEEYSQIYESQNGIIHFESFQEQNRNSSFNITGNDTSIQEFLMKRCNQREIHAISDSSDEGDFHASQKADQTAKEAFDLLNNDISKVQEDVELNTFNVDATRNVSDEIDLTQSSNSNEAQVMALSLTKPSEPSIGENEEILLSNVSDDDNLEKSYEHKSDLKTSNVSNTSAACDDVFVISDEEFNYSVTTSYRDNSRLLKNTINNTLLDGVSPLDEYVFQNKTVPVENVFEDQCNKENDVESRPSHVHFQNNLPTSSPYNQASFPMDKYRLSNHLKLYGSSFFDQIPSCNSSLANSSVPTQKLAEAADTSCGEVKQLHSNEIDFSVHLPDVHLTSSHTTDNVLRCETSQGNSFSMNSRAGVLGTPTDSKYIVKMDNVTPAQDYRAMDTPNIQRELSKYGLKPLKRKRAIQLLEHIYDQTHPVVDRDVLECKRRKICLPDHEEQASGSYGHLTEATRSSLSIPDKQMSDIVTNYNSGDSQSTKSLDAEGSQRAHIPDIVPCDGSQLEDNIYLADSDKIVIKSIHCHSDDWIFQNKEKKKVLGCRIPLHVAFHNYLSVRSKLRDAILRYDPVNIDDIHRGLVANGQRYNPKDLFNFLDKKCITIKTTDKGGASRHKK